MGFKKIIKSFILSSVPKWIIAEVRKPLLQKIEDKEALEYFMNLSFSQEGEDLILARLLGSKSRGFFVDIGAHHPLLYSNTYKFYLLGWRGVNIDALPGSMELFNKLRPEDINIEVPIANDDSNELTYYMFEVPALNTFSKRNAERILSNNPEYPLIAKKDIRPKRLETILNDLNLENREIDFLNLDVEGLELEVLKSNNWNLFRPHYIVVESIDTLLIDDLRSDLNSYLNQQGYTLVSKAVNSMIYKVNNQYINV